LTSQGSPEKVPLKIRSKVPEQACLYLSSKGMGSLWRDGEADQPLDRVRLSLEAH
jgi:hypothetical protein